MRISLFKTVFLIIIFFIASFIWFVAQRIDNNSNYKRNCKNSEEFTTKLQEFAYRVHKILFRLGLTHYLCYGSLWGQIRIGKALPWQSDIEFCLNNEELINDERYIIKTFISSGLDILYNSGDGLYVVTDPASPGMKVELIVFGFDPILEVARRVGWKRRLLPPDCGMVPSLHCFPPILVEVPLPLKQFGEYTFPVPRDGIEIQKYLYRDDWWKEMIPEECANR